MIRQKDFIMSLDVLVLFFVVHLLSAVRYRYFHVYGGCCTKDYSTTGGSTAPVRLPEQKKSITDRQQTADFYPREIFYSSANGSKVSCLFDETDVIKGVIMMGNKTSFPSKLQDIFKEYRTD